ncbi:MAG: hypothetical protein JWL68_802, partial [Actinomycetia bacterium]|nr:hypothetical protein [Actinomycetes bacterium]
RGGLGSRRTACDPAGHPRGRRAWRLACYANFIGAYGQVGAYRPAGGRALLNWPEMAREALADQ